MLLHNVQDILAQFLVGWPHREAPLSIRPQSNVDHKVGIIGQTGEWSGDKVRPHVPVKQPEKFAKS